MTELLGQSPYDARVTWTGDQVQRLRELAGEGKSGGQIARVMGLSRNAIIGKMHRLGVALRGKKEAAQKRARRRGDAGGGTLKRIAGRRVVVQHEVRRVGEPPSRNLPLTELDFGRDCRFPTTESEPHRFCGQPRVAPFKDELSVYCEYHTILTRNQNYRQRGTGHGYATYAPPRRG